MLRIAHEEATRVARPERRSTALSSADPTQPTRLTRNRNLRQRRLVVLLFISVIVCLFSQTARAGFVYDFRFTTSKELSTTGIDGEVAGYFSLPDATMGIINGLSDALLIDELVVTSDTTGTGFAPIGQNLLTYSDPVLGITGWQLLSYNGFVANGTSATGQLIFAAASGGAVGGLRPSLTIGLFPTDSQQRVGIITWNPDVALNLGNREAAAGGLGYGDSIEISAASQVPEPSSIGLFGIGAVSALGAMRRRRWMA